MEKLYSGSGPYQILEKLSDEVYVIEAPKGLTKVHVNHFHGYSVLRDEETVDVQDDRVATETGDVATRTRSKVLSGPREAEG